MLGIASQFTLTVRGITGFVDVVDGETGKLCSTVNVEKTAKLKSRDDTMRFDRWLPIPDLGDV